MRYNILTYLTILFIGGCCLSASNCKRSSQTEFTIDYSDSHEFWSVVFYSAGNEIDQIRNHVFYDFEEYELIFKIHSMYIDSFIERTTIYDKPILYKDKKKMKETVKSFKVKNGISIEPFLNGTGVLSFMEQSDTNYAIKMLQDNLTLIIEQNPEEYATFVRSN